MALTLSIENETSLPDGGPLSVTVTGKRGIDIGRDNHLDWTLPDPSRSISSKHCEIRYYDGGYWLHDVSTNGTYINRSDRRMQGPHRLRNGDRIEIGHYIIAVELDGEEAAPQPGYGEPAQPPNPQELWSGAGEAAPPAAARDFQPARELKPVRPDFLDWAVDTPEAYHDRAAPLPPAHARPAPTAFEDFSWAAGAPAAPPPPEPAPPIPAPRRPSAPSAGASNPWGTPSIVQPPPEPRGFEPLPQTVLAPQEPAGPMPAPFAEPARPVHAPATAPPVEPTPGAATPGDFVRRLAQGAGVPEDVFGRRDSAEIAEELGACLRILADNLKQLLNARAETKRLARSSNQTLIQAEENNPLKFSPTAEDALRLMFGTPTRGYLDARRTLEQSFKDLKTHQVKTYSAMQHALRMMAEDLEPQAVEEGLEADRGLGGLIGSRKARLWDAYVARWDAMTSPHEDGFVDAFMIYFAECYDRGGGGR
jgi:type VI secretion system protein ImpI